MAKAKKLPYVCQILIPTHIQAKSIFDAYCRWRAIRTLGSRFKLKERKNLGLTNEDDETLVKFKSQKALAKNLGVHEQTLSDWATRFNEQVREREFWYCRHWLEGRTATVFQSIVTGISKRQDPALSKLFLQYGLGWKPTERVEEERTVVNITYSLKPKSSKRRRAKVAAPTEKTG